jgi:hypothetical protein
VVLTASIATLIMLLPAAALATPSTITSVTVVPQSIGGYLTTVNWSLPPGYKSGTIEVARDPATGSDGRFYAQNLDTFAFMTTSQTSWSEYIGSGTHYVHVSDCPEASFFCNPAEGEEWSNIYTFVVPESPLPPSSPGSGSPGAGNAPPEPKCKRTGNSVRYTGTTRQGKKACFVLSGDRKRVKLAKFGWRASCSFGSAEGTTAITGHGVKVLNGRFRLSSSGSLFAGRIKSNKASGTLRAQISDSQGSCTSGVVSWRARKG